MCGILGWHKRNSEFTDEEKSKFKNALNLIHSRGPDNTGFYLSPNTLLGHKRLKILDVSNNSNQPYSRVNGKILIYNGEVYNYKELSKRLERETDFLNKNIISDTQIVYEILLRYKQYSVNLFDGMFAFSWHDENENSTLIARDPLGQKPIYYYHDENETIYSSELSPITYLKKNLELSKKNFVQYLKNSYYPGESTPFEKIYKLLPGHFLFLKSGNLSKIRYWNNNPISNIQVNKDLSEQKIVDLFIEKFMESCQKTCVADVPVGIFLSGGIDSSLVYSAYKSLGIDIQSFTVGFHDNEFDESRMARKFISNPDKYNELFLTADDVGQAIDSIFSRIDEPHGDPGLINAYLLTKFAKEKVNVGLTGDGADELFGGYATFHAHALSNKTSFVPRLIFKAMRRIIDFTDDSDGYMNFNFKLKRFLNGNKNRGMFRYLNWISCEENLLLSKLFTDKLIQKYVLSNNLDIDVLEKCDIGKDEFLKGDFDSLLNFYQKNFLSGFVCHHTDRASMLNSFEVRSPFLNKEIINFANTLHKKYKYNSSSTKYILRKALEKLGGTKELVNRKKMGFTMPLARWQKTNLSDDLKNLPIKVLDATDGIINYDTLIEITNKHLKGKKNYYQLIHSLIVFTKWRDNNSSFKFSS